MTDRHAACGVNVFFVGSHEQEWVEDPSCLRPGRIWVAGRWHARPLPPSLPKGLLRKPAAAAQQKPKQQQVQQQQQAQQMQQPAKKQQQQAQRATSNDENDESTTVLVRRSARERENRIVMVGGCCHGCWCIARVGAMGQKAPPFVKAASHVCALAPYPHADMLLGLHTMSQVDGKPVLKMNM